MSLESIFSREIVYPLPAEGTWRAIQFAPNPGAGERLNIGVVFQDKDSKSFYKLLESSAPIRCMFGPRAQENFHFLLELLKESLEAEIFESPSPQIAFGPAKYASGEAGPSIVERLFPEVVTLGRGHSSVEDDDAVPAIANRKLRKRVHDEMERISPVSTKRVWAPKPFVVKTHHASHKLDIPLRTRNRFGSLVSAHYFTPGSRKHSLLSAFADLATARQFVERNEKGALFVLRPPADEQRFTKTVRRQIDEDVEDVAWRLAEIKIDVNRADSEQRLAKDIISWAGR
jgi:hypothetical protein